MGGEASAGGALAYCPSPPLPGDSPLVASPVTRRSLFCWYRRWFQPKENSSILLCSKEPTFWNAHLLLTQPSSLAWLGLLEVIYLIVLLFLEYAILLQPLYAREAKLFAVPRPEPEKRFGATPAAPSVTPVCSVCPSQKAGIYVSVVCVIFFKMTMKVVAQQYTAKILNSMRDEYIQTCSKKMIKSNKITGCGEPVVSEP